jgi:hypothetical protein
MEERATATSMKGSAAATMKALVENDEDATSLYCIFEGWAWEADYQLGSITSHFDLLG